MTAYWSRARTITVEVSQMGVTTHPVNAISDVRLTVNQDLLTLNTGAPAGFSALSTDGNKAYPVLISYLPTRRKHHLNRATFTFTTKLQM